MKENFSFKKGKYSLSSVAILIFTILIVCFLLSVIIAIKTQKGTPVCGQITTENITDDTTYNYSIETINIFKSNIRRYIINFLGLAPEDENKIVIDVGEPLLKCFRRAKISGEKAISFSEYLANCLEPGEVNLENANSKEDFKGIWALIGFFSDIDDSDPENRKLIFAPQNHIIELFNPKLYNATVNDILNNTMLNVDELGRLFLEIFWFDISTNVNDSTVSKEDVFYAFESIVYVYMLSSDFVQDNLSIIQARTLSELIYESGDKLRKIIDKNGIDAFMKALGLEKPLPSLLEDPAYAGLINADGTSSEILSEGSLNGNMFVDSLRFLEEVREAIANNISVFRFIIQAVSMAMINIENINMESAARASQPSTVAPEKYIALSVISSTRTIKKGLEAAFADNETIKTNEDLVQNIAEFLAMSKKVNEPFPTSEAEVEYKLNIKNDLVEYLNTIDEIQNEFLEIKTIEEIDNLTKEQIEKLNASYKSNKATNHIFIEDFNGMLSTVFMNITINAYLRAFKQLDLGGTN